MMLRVFAVSLVTSLVTAGTAESDLASPEHGDCAHTDGWSLCVSGPIVALEGSTVTLPCNCTVPRDTADKGPIKVIWSKGQQYKMSGHVCDSSCGIYGVTDAVQNRHFKGRVSLVHPNSTNTTGDLRLTRLNAEDDGLYFCRIESIDNGFATNKGIRIHVDALPQVLNLSVEGGEGADGGLQLTCLVGGRPLPNVTWEAPSSLTRPLNVSSPEGPLASVLSVLSVPGPATPGTYTCCASNRQGWDAASVEVPGGLHAVLAAVGAMLVCAALGGVAACVWNRRRRARKGGVPLEDDREVHDNVILGAKCEDQKTRLACMDLPSRDPTEECEVTYAAVSVGSSVRSAPGQCEQDDAATVYATIIHGVHP